MNPKQKSTNKCDYPVSKQLKNQEKDKNCCKGMKDYVGKVKNSRGKTKERILKRVLAKKHRRL
jgi:hypothetical protein